MDSRQFRNQHNQPVTLKSIKKSYIDEQSSKIHLKKNYPIQMRCKAINFWSLMEDSAKLKIFEDAFEDYVDSKLEMNKNMVKRTVNRRKVLINLLEQFNADNFKKKNNGQELESFDAKKENIRQSILDTIHK